MVFKCPHRLTPDYFTSKFSEDTTSYNLSDSENNWNVTFEYLTHTFFSKLVLVVVAPHCVMAFLARLRRRNLLGRSNEKSAKISKARQSWQSIQENRIQNFNLSSPLHRMIESHTYTHTSKLGLTLKNALKLSQDSWKQFLLSYLSYHKHSREVCSCLDLGQGK